MGYNLQICRLCVENENLQRIFVNTVSLHDSNTSTSLQQKIQYALNIIIEPTDCSQMICLTCIGKVEGLYAFRLQTLEVQQFLNGVTSILSPTVAPEKITEYYKKMKKTINRPTSLVQQNIHPLPSKEVAMISDQEVASTTTESMDTAMEKNVLPLYPDDSFNDDCGYSVMDQESVESITNITSTSEKLNSSFHLDILENEIQPASKFPIDIYSKAFENKLIECIKNLSSAEIEDEPSVIDKIISETGVLTLPSIEINSKEFIEEVSDMILKIMWKCKMDLLPKLLTNRLHAMPISDGNVLQVTDKDTEQQINNTAFTKRTKSTKKMLKCKYCLNIFKYNIQLDTHVKQAHKFRCIYCSLAYRDKSGLTHHIRKYKCFTFQVEKDGRTLSSTQIDAKLYSKPVVSVSDCMSYKLTSNNVLPPTPPTYLVGKNPLSEEEKTIEKINQKINAVKADRNMNMKQKEKNIKSKVRKLKENLVGQTKTIQNATRNIVYENPQTVVKNTSNDSLLAPMPVIENSKDLNNRCLLNEQEKTIGKTNLAINASKTLDEAKNFNCSTSQDSVKSTATNDSLPPSLQAIPNAVKILNANVIRNKESNLDCSISQDAVKSSATNDSLPPSLQTIPNAVKLLNTSVIHNKESNFDCSISQDAVESTATNDSLLPSLQTIKKTVKMLNTNVIHNKESNFDCSISQDAVKSTATDDSLPPPLQTIQKTVKVLNANVIHNKESNLDTSISQDALKSTETNVSLPPSLQTIQETVKMLNTNVIHNKESNFDCSISQDALKSTATDDSLPPPLQTIQKTVKVLNANVIHNKESNLDTSISQDALKSTETNVSLPPSLQTIQETVKMLNTSVIHNKESNLDTSISQDALKSTETNVSLPPSLQTIQETVKMLNTSVIHNKESNLDTSISQDAVKSIETNDSLPPSLQTVPNAVKLLNTSVIRNKTNNFDCSILEKAVKSTPMNDFLQSPAVQQQSKKLAAMATYKELELAKINQKINASKAVIADVHKIVLSNKAPNSQMNKFKTNSKSDNLTKTNLKRPVSPKTLLNVSASKMLKVDIPSTLNVELIQNKDELIKYTQPPKTLTTSGEIIEQTPPVTSQLTTQATSSGTESMRTGIRVKPLSLLMNRTTTTLPKTQNIINPKSSFQEYTLRCPVEIIYDYNRKNDDDNSRNIHCKIDVAVTDNNEYADTTLKKYPHTDLRLLPSFIENITATCQTLLSSYPKKIPTHNSSTRMTQDIGVSRKRPLDLKNVPPSSDNDKPKIKTYRPNKNTTKIVQTILPNGIETTKLVQPGDKRPAVLLNGNDVYSFEMSGNSINIRNIAESRTIPNDVENKLDENISSADDLVEVYCLQNGKNDNVVPDLNKEDNTTLNVVEDYVEEIIEADEPICISSDEEEEETATVLQRNYKSLRPVPVIRRTKKIANTLLNYSHNVSTTSSSYATVLNNNSNKINNGDIQLRNTDTSNIFHITNIPSGYQGLTKNQGLQLTKVYKNKAKYNIKVISQNHKLKGIPIIISKQRAHVLLPNVKRSNEERPGVERATETISKGGEERPNAEHANIQGANEEPANERTSAERANVEQTNVERATEKRASEERANEERANEKPNNVIVYERINEERANVERTSEERASEERANEERANEERANEERASEERANEERASEERANVGLLNVEHVNEEHSIIEKNNETERGNEGRNDEEPVNLEQNNKEFFERHIKKLANNPKFTRQYLFNDHSYVG